MANAEIGNEKIKKEALNNKLISSIQNKNIKQVKELLSKGANVNYVVSDGDNKEKTAFMIACEQGNKEIVELLLLKDANINAKCKGYRDLVRYKGDPIQPETYEDTYKGYTPLMFASQNGNEKIVELLIFKGANINAKDDFSNDALMIACQNGKKKVVELLISKGANINAKNNDLMTPLMIASKIYNSEITELLISKGANVNYVVSDGVYKGFTPLIFASIYEKYDTAKLLISKGANINYKVTDGRFNGFTPLIFACQNYEYDNYQNSYIVESLIDIKSFTNKTKEKNYNFCINHASNSDPNNYLASNFGHFDIANLLISKGANVNYVIPDGIYKGFTPLIFASQRSNNDLVQLLISKGVNVNYIIPEGVYKGFTLLIFASKSNDKELVELLISKGANVNISIKEGKYKGYNASKFASENNNKNIIEFLKKAIKRT